MKKFEFKFRCDENPLKMEKTTIQNGEKVIDARHCEKCKRNIVDFTKFTPQQISEYYKSSKKPCGFMFPWQEDQVNEFLIQQNGSKTSPLLKYAKIAAVVSTPLLASPAFGQKNTPSTEVNNVNKSGAEGNKTEVLLRDTKDEPLELIVMEVFSGSELLGTITSDSDGRLSIIHENYQGKSVITLKNKVLNIEITVALKNESNCIVWKTQFSKKEKEVMEQTNKYDLEFVYSDKNDRPIRRTKIDVEFYDTTNTLIEIKTIRSNMSGHSFFNSADMGKVQYVNFILYTKHGRKTAYKSVAEFNKTEVNQVRVNKKYRMYTAGFIMLALVFSVFI